jgi:nucleotide-binding universal stress UspA family protein
LPDFARILVPTDFSPAADEAIAFARKLALKFTAALHIVHVLDNQPISELAATLRILDAQVTAEERAQFAVTTALLRGPVASTIVNYARGHAIDLIVMGSDGQEGGHGLLGRVVERVVRLGPCPVLTVKEERTDSAEMSASRGHTASPFV